MQIKNTFYLLLSMLCFVGFAQQKDTFRAFGELPRMVDYKLYENLKYSENQEIRFKYLDTIAQIYLESGHADSLMHYGHLIKNEALYKGRNIKNRDEIQLSGLYFEGVAAQKMGLLEESIKSLIEGIESSNSEQSIQKYLKLGLAETYLLKVELEKAKVLLEELPQEKAPHDFYLKNEVVKSQYLILSNDLDLAEIMINNALSEEFIDDYQKLKLELQLNLSEVELRRGHFESVLETVNNIKTTALNSGFYDLYIEATLEIGFSHAMLEEYDASEVVLTTAYINTIQWNRLELEQKVIGDLVKLYNVREDYKNAYNLITQYQRVTKEIADKQNQRLVKDLELKYETLKKEKEISQLQEDQILQQAEIERQKTIKYAFLIGFLVILIPIILLLIVYYQKLQTQSLLNKQQEAINQQEVTTLLQSQELELAKNTISVQSKERDRIARELHDSIGGNLAGIKLKMNSLGDDKPEFKQILSLLDATYNQVREISHSLIPKEFEGSAFTDLVNSYLDSISKDASVNLRFEAYPNDEVNAIDVSIQVSLFNIIKELVTNALKHAKAEEINVQITSFSEDKSIELLYEDDGVGFDLNKTNKGIGLKNMETRVANFKGRISIDTAVNRGTVISISLPQN